MTRRELREHIFRELFTSEFYPEDGGIREEQMRLYFTHEGDDGLDSPPAGVEGEEQEEILEKTKAVLERADEIDSLISKASISWPIGRMNRTDLSILRLGVYELVCDETIPQGVAINEAVLLARKFGGEDSYSFVNGILGKIHKEHQGVEAE